MRFFVDNQLPRLLANWIRQQGHEAEHALDVQLDQAKDNPIWRHAKNNGEVIVSKDEDFAEWVRRGREGPQVLWIRFGNGSTRVLLAWLEPLFPSAVTRLEQGDRLVELR